MYAKKPEIDGWTMCLMPVLGHWASNWYPCHLSGPKSQHWSLANTKTLWCSATGSSSQMLTDYSDGNAKSLTPSDSLWII